MPLIPAGVHDLDPRTLEFYRRALAAVSEPGIPFLVGGAFLLEHYTGIVRRTKDFDIFVRPDDCEVVLATLERAGYHTELTYPHWLGKAFYADAFIDVIFGSGNGVAVVDDIWFEHAVHGEMFGLSLKFCPPEEIIWSKAFIMERERYDGADVAHLLRACGPRLDWSRLLGRFGAYWRVLLSHLILFGFIYPGERSQVPAWVMQDLVGRLQREIQSPSPPDRVCQGTLLSRAQYLIDVELWGYADARVHPRGPMSPEETAHWTAAIDV